MQGGRIFEGLGVGFATQGCPVANKQITHRTDKLARALCVAPPRLPHFIIPRMRSASSPHEATPLVRIHPPSQRTKKHSTELVLHRGWD